MKCAVCPALPHELALESDSAAPIIISCEVFVYGCMIEPRPGAIYLSRTHAMCHRTQVLSVKGDRTRARPLTGAPALTHGRIGTIRTARQSRRGRHHRICRAMTVAISARFGPQKWSKTLSNRSTSTQLVMWQETPGALSFPARHYFLHCQQEVLPGLVSHPGPHHRC